MRCQFLGNGVIVCGGRSKAQPCSTPGCRGRGELLCDYPVTRAGKAATCDRPVCRRCATSVGPDKDHCGPHAKAAKEAEGQP